MVAFVSNVASLVDSDKPSVGRRLGGSAPRTVSFFTGTHFAMKWEDGVRILQLIANRVCGL